MENRMGGFRFLQHTIFIVMICFFSSCQKKKFDKEKWAEMGDIMSFPNRDAMLDDLLENQDLKQKSYLQIVELLGNPQFKLDSTMEIGYAIDEDYGTDIDPVYVKTLVIQFDQDTLVRGFKVDEWRK